MKKSIYLIPALALALACSGGEAPAEKAEENNKEEIETLDKAVQEVDEAIEQSEEELEEAEGEIDTLLNDI